MSNTLKKQQFLDREFVYQMLSAEDRYAQRC